MKQVLKVGSLASLLLFSGSLAAEWGSENWGSMVWGQSTANVPLMGSFSQVIFFLLLLVIGLFASRRWGIVRRLPAVVEIAYLPLLAEADPIQLNVFQNGQVADADDVNENFQTIANAISTNDCATASQLNAVETKIDNIQASGSCSQFDIAVYNQGKVDGANEVDLTSDNQALCQRSGGTYDSTQDTCTVDITTDNSTLCENSGGVYVASNNSCTVDISSDNPTCDWQSTVWNGTDCVLFTNIGQDTPTDICGDSIEYQCNGTLNQLQEIQIRYESLGMEFDISLWPHQIEYLASSPGALSLETYCSNGQSSVVLNGQPISELNTCDRCVNELSNGYAELVIDENNIASCQDINECAVNNLGQNSCGDTNMWSCQNYDWGNPLCTPLNCKSSCGGATPFCIMDEVANTQTCSTNRVVVKHQYSNGWIWLQHESGSKYLRGGGLTQICGRSVSTIYPPSNGYGGTTQVNIGNSAGFIVGQNYPVNTDASAPGCP